MFTSSIEIKFSSGQICELSFVQLFCEHCVLKISAKSQAELVNLSWFLLTTKYCPPIICFIINQLKFLQILDIQKKKSPLKKSFFPFSSFSFCLFNSFFFFLFLFFLAITKEKLCKTRIFHSILMCTNIVLFIHVQWQAIMIEETVPSLSQLMFP